MDERAALYMSGTPESVISDSYLDGPTPYSLDIVLYMTEGQILVGKNRKGDVVFMEQLVNGKFVTWDFVI
jgi:hypothetical protein